MPQHPEKSSSTKEAKNPEINMSLVVYSRSPTSGLLVLVDQNDEGKFITPHIKGHPTPNLIDTFRLNNQTDIDPNFFRSPTLLMDFRMVSSSDFIYTTTLHPEIASKYLNNHPSLKLIPFNEAIQQAGDDVSRESFTRVLNGEQNYLLS